ncbi:MAG: hypothetical protein H6607_06535 [Flavobacteriales bacterium]|nr:hypothetical protein [Flavobacteriales bacterium]
MTLFDRFRIKKQIGSNKKTRSIFYHEDDFRQVEVIPIENLSLLEAESIEDNNLINKELNRSYGNASYVLNKIGLNHRKIKPNDIENMLSVLELEKISKVYTGYGQTYRVMRENCVAFGKGYSAVFYDFTDNVVEHIWFTNHWSINKELLTKTLYKIGTKWDLLLQDWQLTITVDLRDKNALEKYLKTYDES